MRELQRQGRQAEALAAFVAFRDALGSLGGAQPAAETLALAESFRGHPDRGVSAPMEARAAHPGPPRHGGAADLTAATPSQQGGAVRSRRRMAALAAALVVGIAAAAAAAALWRGEQNKGESTETLSLVLHPPTLAVLPFANLSGRPEQDAFADSFTEDLITSLSRNSRLKVIARNSVFQYKDRSPDVREVGAALNVRWVLEGSVRQVDGQVRITAQLVNAREGTHVWAESYDREAAGVLAIQDDIRNRIVTELEVKLTEGEQMRAWRSGTRNVEAYETLIKGYEQFLLITPESLAQAEALAIRAAELDPNFAMAYVIRGFAQLVTGAQGFSDDPQALYVKAEEMAQIAFRLEPGLPDAFGMLGWVRLLQRRYDEAIDLVRKAVQLDPNRAKMRAVLSSALCYSGQFREALEHGLKAFRLNPFPPIWYFENLGIPYRHLGQYERSVEVFEAALQSTAPSDSWYQVTHRMNLIAAYVEMGQMNQARRYVEEILEIDPNFSVDVYTEWDVNVYRDRKHGEHYRELLRKAGLK
jgi:adenylate cyclase